MSTSPLVHLFERVAPPALAIGKLDQGAQGVVFGFMAIAAHATWQANLPPFPKHNPVAKQGWQCAQQIESMPVGVRDVMGQPNVLGEQSELQRRRSRRGQGEAPDTISGTGQRFYINIMNLA